MRLNEYQELALRTADHSRQNRKHYYAIGLAGELGEVLNVLKKHFFHGHPLEKIQGKLMEEIGDTLWYGAALMHELDAALGYSDDEGFDTIQAALPDDVRVNSDMLLKMHALNGTISMNVRIGQVTSARENVRTLVAGLAVLAKHFGSSLNYCAEQNIAKLQLRYPQGFTQEASINRKD